MEERGVLGEHIARYRDDVLVWRLQAARAASPRIDLEGTSGRTRGPAEEFRHRLTVAIAASTAGLPSLDELTAEQKFPLVETWRKGGVDLPHSASTTSALASGTDTSAMINA